MYDEKDYLKYLIDKVEENHNGNNFLEEKIYQDCLDKFRLMLKNKRQLNYYKRGKRR